jgi:hypothetical protein
MNKIIIHRIIVFFSSILISCILISCSGGEKKPLFLDILLKNIDDKELWNQVNSQITIIDTLEEYSLNQNKVRLDHSKIQNEKYIYGPITFDRFAGVLVETIKKGSLEQIDIYFDSINEWLLIPKMNEGKTIHLIVDNLFHTVTPSDFRYLSKSIDSSLGWRKEISTDGKEIVWSSSSQKTRLQFKDNAIRITKYKLNITKSYKDFEFHRFQSDSTPLNVGLRQTITELRKQYSLRDTVAGETKDSLLISDCDFWGIPGQILFKLDNKGEVEAINWSDNTFGEAVDVNIFYRILSSLEEKLGKSRSIPENKLNSTTDRSYYWEIGNEIIYLNFYSGNFILFVRLDRMKYPFNEELR